MPLSTDILTQQIKSEAQRLGFFACGMAKAEPVSPEVRQAMQQWLADGDNAGMEYMARYTRQRLNPRLLMPETKTIVSLAMNYTPQKTMPAEGYQIAAYAYGKDYHDVVRQRLYRLLDYIRSLLPDVHGRVCCDTAPILERYWAVKAGLGWIGKNRQLIIYRKRDACEVISGSMVILGELLLDAELRYDRQQCNRCGTCRRCIDACPAKVLGQPSFNAGRCLSYQLIENRGRLSDEAKRQMGRYIYGCDQCQKACPWNRFAKPTDVEELHPSERLLQMTDTDWEQLDEEAYRTLFKGSAVKRAKYAGLRRNIDAARSKKDR